MLFQKAVTGIFQKQFLSRCDDTGIAHYFSAGDFPGLKQESYPFPSSLGHTLQGYFYHYDSPVPGRLVIFDHGFGGGHRSYMKEIEMLCRRGYLVFSYDHTGCMESGGESARGLSQSLCDLNDCLTALKAHPDYRECRLSVMGHSWGGFATLNICRFYPEISHIVVLSGFISVQMLLSQFFGGVLKGYQKGILSVEGQNNPSFVGCDAVSALRETDAKVLLIYSANDPLVKKEIHYDTLKKALSHKENVRFLLLPNKGHNPNYTEDAVKYLGEYTAAVQKQTKKKLLQTQAQKKAFRDSFDWHRMTVQDEALWEEVFKTLDT